MKKGGASYASIAREYPPWTPETVGNACKFAEQREDHQSAPRGSPRKTNVRDDRLLKRSAIKSDPKGRRQSLTELKNNVTPGVSRRTVQRRLQESLIQKWRAANRPLLNVDNRRSRRAWAQLYRSWKWEQWRRVCWCDEMSVTKQDGAENVWVFRMPGEKWDQECIEKKDCGSRTSLMFFDCFAGRRMDTLVSLWPNEERTGKKGITGLIILDAMKESVPEIMDSVTDRILMLDNAKTHKIKEIKEWCAEHEYEVMEWPPYSPDLNPIKMIWKKVKNMVYKAHPELRTSTLGSDSLKNEIEKAVFEAWEALDPDWCQNLMKSMPRRVEAVLKASGGYTKY